MNKKTMLGVPFTIIAGLMLLASTAYACTVWAGKFLVNGEAAAGGATVTATGTPTGCSGTTPTGGMTQSVNANVAKTKKSPAVGTVTVETQSAGGTCNWLPGGVYDINWYSGKGYSNHTTWSRDCMSPLMGLGVKVGEIKVNSAGQSVDPITNAAASFTFNITSPFANIGSEEGAVCVSDATGTYGNQAPMKVIV